MNRVSSLIFATATTALTGAAVVMAAGGTIFGLDKITPSGGQPAQADDSASAPLVRASYRQEPSAETAVAAVETEVPFAAAGWTEGASGGESEAIAPELPAAPTAAGSQERSTPPSASTPTPSTPTTAPAPNAPPPPTSTPELSEPPSFSMPPTEPTAAAKTPAPAAPPAAAAQAPAAPTTPPAPSSTPSPWEDDDDEDDDRDDHDEDDDHDDHDEDEDDD